MSINKTTFYSFFVYAFVQISPVLITPFSPSKSFYIYFMIFVFFVGAIVLFFLYRRAQPIALEKAKIPFTPKKIMIVGLLSVLALFLVQALASIIESYVFKLNPQSQNTQQLSTIADSIPLFLLVISVAGPFMEELVFRRSIIGWLNQYLNVWIAIIISSALFAIIHFDGHYLLYFSMGMLLALIYKRSATIWTSTIAHSVMNLVVVLIYLLNS